MIDKLSLGGKKCYSGSGQLGNKGVCRLGDEERSGSWR